MEPNEIPIFQCTAQCGEGKEYRDVYCSGACSQTDRPQASKPCNATKPCSGHWVTGIIT